jgi:acetylornithine/succinyldiaminopimelate/putrescine aminotransferase
VIDLIEEENLMSNALETGAYLREKLDELREKHALIGEVRGMGLMQAIELVRDRKTKEPAVEETAQLMEALARTGCSWGKAACSATSSGSRRRSISAKQTWMSLRARWMPAWRNVPPCTPRRDSRLAPRCALPHLCDKASLTEVHTCAPAPFE